MSTKKKSRHDESGDSESSSLSDLSDVEKKPVKKKTKAKKPHSSSDSGSDSSDEVVPRKKAKEEKKDKDGSKMKTVRSADGVKMIDLGSRKYASVKTFRNNKFVDIREYYTKDGDDLLPGKKGISLRPDQWANLKKAIGKLDDWL